MKKANKKVLPDIEFEGKIVKPVHGYYQCPYKCGDARYPLPKWKTEKGFRGHMEKCSEKPSVVLEREKRRVKCLEEETLAREKALTNCKRKIGDKIFYVKEVITKPTHVQRGTRMVKVRYEPEKIFLPETAEIKTIDYNGYIVYNHYISEYDIVDSMEEAEAKAERKKKSWDEHCAFSSFCR